MFLPRITQVELNNKSYITKRGVGQALFALKEEQGKSFHVNARVIPLCPMTAKVVPRNLHSKVVPIMQLFEGFLLVPEGGFSKALANPEFRFWPTLALHNQYPLLQVRWSTQNENQLRSYACILCT